MKHTKTKALDRMPAAPASARSQLEHDLLDGLHVPPDPQRLFVLGLMEQLARMERGQVVISSLPACNSEA